MSKTIRFIIITLLISMMLHVFVFAQEPAEPVIPTEPEIVDMSVDFSTVNKFLRIGDKPDISGATVTLKYSDGTEITENLVNEMLPENLVTDTVGLTYIPILVNQREFVLCVTVMNEQADMYVYKDLETDFWGFDAIRKCVMAGFFRGVAEDEFGITSYISRAEFCQMLYNIYKNSPDVMDMTQEIQFTDVEEGKWYYEAIMACAKSGIVNGIGDGLFDPVSPITRQDAALMMMRIIVGEEALSQTDSDAVLVTARENGIPAVDFDDVSDYARNALALSLGVLYNGTDEGKVNPKFNIMRCETATMISNYFLKDYVLPELPPPKYLVYLSPSNQMSNRYAGFDDVNVVSEGIQMQQVADYAKEYLEEMGYEVYICDVELSIRDEEFNRAIEAKQMGADAYVAIHSNSMPGNTGKYQGTTCFYNGNNEGAQQLSQAIYDRVAALTPTKDNGNRNDMLEQTPFSEVWRPEMANLIIEVEYHDHYPYAKWIVENTQPLALAIAQGIDDYFKAK